MRRLGPLANCMLHSALGVVLALYLALRSFDGAGGAGITVRIAVEPSVANAGSVVLITGEGFLTGEPISVGLDGRRAATTIAAAGGLLPVTGLVLPIAVASGAHQVFAQGLRSGRVGRAALTISPLNPTLRVRNGPTSPGALVVVHGEGFLPREQIALALNGAEQEVAAGAPGHSGLLTGPDGQFDASFQAPVSLLAGVNTLSATGSVSQRTALTQVIAKLPVRSDFLFAGATTIGDDRPLLALLNPGHLPASVHLSLFPEPGAQVVRAGAEVRVPPFHRVTVAVSPLAGLSRRFGLRVQADRRIAAQLVLNSSTGSRSVAPVSAPRTTWLLAEGFTGLTFRETIAILNPNGTAARVQVRLLPKNGQAGKLLARQVPPFHELVIDVNRYVPHSSIAAAISASSPVVVSRTLRFGRGGSGATTTLGTPYASSTWLFAEGSTEDSTQTYLTILNPSGISATVTASFYDDLGHPLGNHTLIVQPRHRGTLRVNSVLGSARFATFVTASAPVVVERPMYLGDPNSTGTAGTDMPGSNGPAPFASFADGIAGRDAHEYILLLNPTAHTARVAVTLFPAAQARWTRAMQVAVRLGPLSRHTIDVAAILNLLPSGEHASIVQALNGVGFVAEQTIYVRTTAGMTLRSTQALAQ